MAISRITTWAAGNTLTAAALNAEFDGVYSKVGDITGPATVSGVWTFSANPVLNANAITETMIADGTLLARLAAAETVAGAWTFSTAPTFSTALAITGGGTGATTAAAARTALGLGTAAVENTPLVVAKGGTALTALGSALQFLRVNAGATALEYTAAPTGDFASGGDTAGANRTLGNNDAFSLSFETSGTTRAKIASGGNVAFGASLPSGDGTVHIHSASAGSVTANTEADDLVVENSGDVGLSFLCPNTNIAYIDFGDENDNDRASILYDHATDHMVFTTAGVLVGTQLQLVDEGALFMGSLSSVPATDGGGGFLYVQSGALKYKGAAGTVTTIAVT
jgi:hypothetical protein